MIDSAVVFVSLVVLLAGVTGASAQSLQADFSPSIVERIARRGEEVKGRPAEADSSVAIEGRSLLLQIERPYARPGDRWIEGKLTLRPELGPLAYQTRLEVKLFPFASEQPLETLSVLPDRESGRLFIDLRARKLDKAELTVELFDGGRRTGAARAMLSAKPFQLVAPGRKIAVNLDVPHGAGPVKQWPATFGVPFPEGSLWDANGLRLVNQAGREIASQKEVTGHWSRDGAIQWVRFDALVTPEEGCFVEAAAPGPGAAPNPPLSVVEEGGKVVVDTGVARYVLAQGPSPIEEIRMDGRQVAAVAAGARGLYVVDQKGRLASASAEGETMKIESHGPVAACVRFEGFYRTAEGVELARHITRVECFAGQPMADVTHTLILTQDSNEVWFKEIGWEFAVAPGAAPNALFASSVSEPDKHLRVPLSPAAPSAYMLQDSHYHFAHGANHFSVAVVGRDRSVDTRLEGEECGSWAALVGNSAGLQVFCRDAARQHPKEFEVFADRIVLKLFSNRAGEELDFRSAALVKKWDLEGWCRHSTRPVRRDPAVIKAFIEEVLAYKSNAVGWAKTHQLMINPLAARNAVQAASRVGYLHQHPVYALADPWWIYASKAMGPLYPKDLQRFPQVEAAQEAAIQYWMDRDRKWGENGLVDYCAGPHLGGAHVGEDRFYPMQFRYSYCTYSLRGNLWRLYARSGRRAVRDFAAGSVGSHIDNIHAHWTPPAGSRLVRGLFRSASGLGFDLPFYWGDGPSLEIESSTNFNSYLDFHHLTGCRRARECVEQYADGIQKIWTPDAARRTGRIIMLHRLLVQSYSLTWDRDLRDLAEATADLFEDPEGALLLTKNRPYRSTSYKTRVDVRALIEARRMLGTPRYRRLARTLAEHHWRNYLGSDGIGDYNDPSNILGHFLYEETGDPVYAQALAVCVRNNIAGYDPKTRTFPPGHISGAHIVTNIFEMDYALDVLARSGADKGDVASWMSYDDDGGYSAIYVRKPDEAAAVLYFGRGLQDGSKTSVREGSTYGSTDIVRLGTPAGRRTESGLDVNSVWQMSMGTGKAVIPKDAPGLAYPLLFGERGRRHVFATTRIPLVLHAPGAWLPAPLDDASYSRKERPVFTTFRYYFLAPEGSKDPQIYFEGSGRLFEPGGKPFQQGKPLPGWVRLPADRPGLWAFEGVVNKRVQVKNLPPFFAVGDPESYFLPDVPWAPQEALGPAKRAGEDGQGEQ